VNSQMLGGGWSCCCIQPCDELSQVPAAVRGHTNRCTPLLLHIAWPRIRPHCLTPSLLMLLFAGAHRSAAPTAGRLQRRATCITR
jgi:hypothetical protein